MSSEGIGCRHKGALVALLASVLCLAVALPSGAATPRGAPRERRGGAAATPAGCPWVAASRAHVASPGSLATEVEQRMTLEEKLDFIFLVGASTVENTNTGVPSLCIPPITLSDGPNGISNHTPGSLQLPASIGIAASFDTSVARTYGKVLGAEAYRKGIDAVQAPELNLARVPESGRIFEAYGEDPFLTGAMGVAEVEGIQSQGVLADAKHFSAYNQETARPRLEEVVGRRALEELYNAPFRAVVEQGHVASVMCAYSDLNGVNDCANPVLYADLRSWGFTGFVRSDLGSVTTPGEAFRNGLDLIKPGSLTELADLVDRKELPLADVDRAVVAVLRQMFAYGLIAHPRPLTTGVSTITPGNLAFARAAAERSMVLLKNDGGILPLEPDRLSSLAVIGTDANTDPMSTGFGSAYVASASVVSPLQSLEAALPATPISYVPGGVPINEVPSLSSADLVSGQPLTGTRHGHPHPIEPGTADIGIVTAANVRRSVLTATRPGRGPGWEMWRAVLDVPRSGEYELSFQEVGDLFCYLGGKLVFSSAGLHGPSRWATEVHLAAGQHDRLVLRWYAVARAGAPRVGLVDVSPLIAQAADAARHAKVALVFVSDLTKEGVDRPSLSLPGDANTLIRAVAAANPNTVVVLNTGGAVLMPWLDKVRGVLEAWYPGEQDGPATAAVLTGAVDPSGRLPLTFPPSQAETPVSSPSQYPGIRGRVTYSEGLDIGYRWYLAHHVRPLFPFGYGMSYTSFRFADASVTSTSGGADIRLTVRNTGHRTGRAVVEAYLAYPTAAGEPPEQLRAFAPVQLAPGASRRVDLTIPASGFQAFLGGRWTVVPGIYRVGIGPDAMQLPIQLLTSAPRTTGASGASGTSGVSGSLGVSGTSDKRGPSGTNGGMKAPRRGR